MVQSEAKTMGNVSHENRLKDENVKGPEIRIWGTRHRAPHLGLDAEARRAQPRGGLHNIAEATT
jgi:hypothetical protein